MEELKAEVLNYLKALEDLPKFIQGGKFTEKTILSIHRILTKDVLEKLIKLGVLKSEGKGRGVKYILA